MPLSLEQTRKRKRANEALLCNVKRTTFEGSSHEVHDYSNRTDATIVCCESRMEFIVTHEE